ncbi:hypothetical protein DY000_02040845 [Brassica cretica]|uniref:Uncharacterized protein n=1 Tax=Brassica cretica TaxID=69181 RepID=A0ABQ7BHT1_BRACR|nr:hypothetical protein DY000_02040845 [Brassica cretica]
MGRRSFGHLLANQTRKRGGLLSVLNSQVQSKITEAVDFVFGESAFWNPAAKAKALLFEELKPYIGRKFQYKFLDVGCIKNVRDDLQYLEVWSFHSKEYDAGNITQRNYHVIDKNISCFFVWLAPSKLLFPVGLVRHIKQRIETTLLLDMCVISGNKLASGIAAAIPQLLCDPSFHQFSFGVHIQTLPVECSYLRAYQCRSTVIPEHGASSSIDNSLVASNDNSLVASIDGLKGVSIDIPFLESIATFSEPTSDS